MPAFVERMRRLWTEVIAGPELRSYETACEELGGVPWRTVQKTERWFIAQTASPPPLPAGALDSAALILPRTTLASLLRGPLVFILGGAALLALVIGAIALSSGGTAHAAQLAVASRGAPPPRATPPVSSSPAPAGAVMIARRATAPAQSQPAPHDGLSPSVRALFASSGSHAGASARKSSRARHHKRRR